MSRIPWICLLALIMFFLGGVIQKMEQDDTYVLPKREWKCILWEDRAVIADDGSFEKVLNTQDAFKQCVGYVKVQVWQPTN